MLAQKVIIFTYSLIIHSSYITFLTLLHEFNHALSGDGRGGGDG